MYGTVLESLLYRAPTRRPSSRKFYWRRMRGKAGEARGFCLPGKMSEAVSAMLGSGSLVRVEESFLL